MKQVKQSDFTMLPCRSQRGSTLWTSSSAIRASPETRQALPIKSLAAKAKGGVLTGQLEQLARLTTHSHLDWSLQPETPGVQRLGLVCA